MEGEKVRRPLLASRKYSSGKLLPCRSTCQLHAAAGRCWRKTRASPLSHLSVSQGCLYGADSKQRSSLARIRETQLSGFDLCPEGLASLRRAGRLLAVDGFLLVYFVLEIFLQHNYFRWHFFSWTFESFDTPICLQLPEIKFYVKSKCVGMWNLSSKFTKAFGMCRLWKWYWLLWFK